MAKAHSIGIRFKPETKSALEVLAREDGRSLSSFIARVVETWLRDRTQPSVASHQEREPQRRRA